MSAHLIERKAPVHESDGSTQTDVLHPRPVTPPYRAPKRGVDAETQIEAGTAEWQPRGATGAGTDVLFNFDDEVSSLIDGLSSAIIDQSEVEISHEEGLVALAARRETAQSVLDRDAAVERELENKAKAAAQRKDAVVSSAREGYNRSVAAMEKVSAAAMARSAINAGAVPGAMATLRSQSYFTDAARQAVEGQVLPHVYDALRANLSSRDASGGVLDSVISDSLEAGEAAFRDRLAADEKARAENEKKYYIRVFVRVPRRPEDVEKNGVLPAGTLVPCDPLPDNSSDADDGRPATSAGSLADSARDRGVPVEDAQQDDGSCMRTVVVGPVPVRKIDPVSDIEKRIHGWLLGHSNAHTRRVQAMAGGQTRPLCLYLDGARLSSSSLLLSRPLSSLGGLELRPQGEGGVWDTEVPEE